MHNKLSSICSSNHRPWLDWIRFLASILVVIGHSASFVYDKALFDDPGGCLQAVYLQFFGGLGHEAVLIFFVLSGYFVFGGMLKNLTAKRFSPVNYAIDRFTRIIPPMLLAIAFTVITTSVIGQQVDWISVAGNMLAIQGLLLANPLQNNPSFWTLSYEIWFYVLAGGLGLAVTAANFSRYVGFLILLTALIAFTQLRSSYLFCWMLGGLAYVCVPQRITGPAFGAGILLMLIQFFLRPGREFNGPLSPVLTIIQGQSHALKLLFSFGACIAIWQLGSFRARSSFMKQIESLGPKLAASSYSLYLIHYPVLLWFEHFGVRRHDGVGLSSLAIHLGLIMACAALGWCAWWVVERRTGIMRVFVRALVDKYISLKAFE